MTIGVAIHGKFRVIGTVDVLEFADRVTEALLELERYPPAVLDSAVSADRGQRVVGIEVSVSGQFEDEAVAAGQAAAQSAITAAGGELVSLLGRATVAERDTSAVRGRPSSPDVALGARRAVAAKYG